MITDFRHDLFKTPIWGFSYIDKDYIKRLELTILEMSKQIENRDKSNFLGWQSPDTLYKYEWMHPLCDAILSVCQGEITQQFKNTIPENYVFGIESMWANVNPTHAFNMAHIHGAEISGVYYVKVPEGKSGRICFVDPRQRVNMSEKFIKDFNYPVTPEVGTLILFPSWLEHYVEPNETEETRISISFNIR